MTSTKTSYVVRMVSNEGQVFFYTGRAGSGWTSANIADACCYPTMDGARTRACHINANTALHGFHAIGFEAN